MDLHGIDDSDDGEPGPVDVHPWRRVEALDAEPFGGHASEHDHRYLFTCRVEEPPVGHVGAQHVQEIGVHSEHGDAAGFELRDQVVAPHGSSSARCGRDLLDGSDAAGHGHRLLGNLRPGSEDAGSRFDSEQVGAEIVERGEEIGPTRCRDAQDGDDGSNADRDPECREYCSCGP